MTRLVSGVALAASAFALVWFLPSPALLAVALAVAGLAFLEYAKLARAVDAPLPFLPSLAATLAACAAVALPWVHVPSLFGVIIVALAVSLMTSGLHGAPLVHGAAAGMLAPVYIGLPLGALVGIHQIAGREGVLTLIATVAVPPCPPLPCPPQPAPKVVMPGLCATASAVQSKAAAIDE